MRDNVSYLEEIVAAYNLEGFKDVFWNLGQVVAWVETRSPFPVDALSDSTQDLARRDHSMRACVPHYAAEFADRSADQNGLARVKSPFQSIDDVRRAVLRSFQSGELAASGQWRDSSLREPIPSLDWADLTIEDSFKGEMIVRHRDGSLTPWKDIRVKGAEVVSAFAVPSAQLPASAPSAQALVSYRSGLPGKPTSKHLYLQKLSERIKAGQLAPTLKDEATFLKGWLKQTHPSAPPGGMSAIKNAIRDAYNQGKGQAPNIKISG
jgi:hypothetical protein